MTGTIGILVSVAVGITAFFILFEKVRDDIVTPIKKLKEQVDSQGRDIEALKHHDEKDYEEIASIKEVVKLHLKCEVDVMNHMVYGNHTKDLLKSRDEAMDLITKV